MKRSLFIPLVIFVTTLQAAHAQECTHAGRHVVYGDHQSRVYPVSTATERIFLDKEGHLYPEFPVDNATLQRHCGSLKRALLQDSLLLFTVAHGYGILPGSVNIDSVFTLLQERIAARLISRINNNSANAQAVSLLIHGFRKPFHDNGEDSTSVSDNFFAKKDILRSSGLQHYFVEVYWDGMHMPFRIQETRRLSQLFESASLPSAAQAGTGLRAVVSRLQTPRLNLFTHSLGARVAASLLFNPGSSIREKQLPTPSQQRLEVCMVAPAVGSVLFRNYFDRTTHIPYLVKDNYSLSVLYNTDDVALLKQVGIFGPGAYRYGVTSLGCNRDGDVFALYQMHRNSYPTFNYRAFDFSGSAWHNFHSYHGRPAFDAVIKYMER
ncbi:MAG: hypothetical protein K0Q66_1471 [Chitinophagaceae bacterium]|nr:hypothetical protein [Chitinophagaceae bacterium]